MKVLRQAVVLLTVLGASTATMAQQTTDERISALEAELERQKGVIVEQQQRLQALEPTVEELDELDLARQLEMVRRDVARHSPAEGSEDTWLEINGWLNFDFIYDFDRVDPTWEATLRPTTISTTPGEFGQDGNTIFSVKQTRLGLTGGMPTRVGDAFWWIEFDLFGLNNDAGQTAITLRHAWGEVGPIGFGWTWSNFMDIDIWPNVLDWWGPSAMALNRNPQLRYTWDWEGATFALALENSNASLTSGVFGETSPGFDEALRGRTQFPDLTSHYRRTYDWGHIQVGGVLRQLAYETLGTPGNEPEGSEFGWGINLTGVIGVFGQDKIKAGLVFGEGIGSFINDGGGVNLAPSSSGGAEAVASTGLTLYYDHYWDEALSSSIGFSYNDNDTTPLQSADEIDSVAYMSTNLIWAPSQSFWLGLELQYGERDNVDGASASDLRVQFQLRYNFSERLK